MQAGKFSKNILILLVIPLILVLFSSVIYFSLKDIKVFAGKLKPNPERFTELYFEDHTLLPKIALNNTVYDFSFTVRNLEYTPMEYPYKVYIEPENGERQILDEGSFYLKHDEYKTIVEGFKILSTDRRVKVTVELIDKKQLIHFWMEAESI